MKKHSKLFYASFVILSLLAISLATMVNHSQGHLFNSPNQDQASARNETSSQNKAQDESQSESQEDQPSDLPSSQSQSEEATSDESLDEAIYDVDLMAANGIDPINPDDYDSVDQIIDHLINDLGIDPSTVSVSFHNLISDERYNLNEDVYRISASIYKVPIAAMMLDQIEAGTYDFNSQIPFQESYYLEGSGAISNSPLRSSYSVQELLEESLIHSDNTAAYTLMFGVYGSFANSRQAVIDFLGLTNVPDYFFSENYYTSSILEDIYSIIMNDPKYTYIIDLLKQAEPHQLFTSYVKEGMANKYGRYDSMINDSGIYYENDQAIYSLVIMTDGSPSADVFIELSNLYINQWVRAKYLN